MFLANGLFPGPLIEANEGDNITVRVLNKNKASTVSIHWHGIHQKGTPFSDGAASITQCALGPNQVQEYNFIAYPSGTHYWHDHAAYHMVDGIAGPLIVRPKTPDPFAYDEERVSRSVYAEAVSSDILKLTNTHSPVCLYPKDPFPSGLVHRNWNTTIGRPSVVSFCLDWQPQFLSYQWEGHRA